MADAEWSRCGTWQDPSSYLVEDKGLDRGGTRFFEQ